MDRYTAKEMRELAEMIDHGGAFTLTDPSIVESNVAMLRQAADDMEREKRWEYAVMYTALSGCRCISPGRADCIAATKNILSLYNKECEDANIVRREVGEWEEVKNEEV